MFYLMMTANLTMSIMFLFMNHPMSMGLILLIQTVLISLMTGLMSFTYWFSYILFLVMLGGMLVLFIYMTSLASNEMFSFSMKLTMTMMIIMMIAIMILIISDYSMINVMLKNSNLTNMKFEILMDENINTLNKIYNSPNMIITILLINYLLLTLIAVVKITNINMGPLRQKF